jgi:hypothetical protein
MDEELERFKRLKLHEYAASLGYELDARETPKRETVMRKDGDKTIRTDADGHCVFRDEGDHGSIRSDGKTVVPSPSRYAEFGSGMAVL